MDTIHINGADVHPALLIINIAISVGYVIQWIIFATIVSRSNTQIMLSRQPSNYNSSSNECDSRGEGAAAAAESGSRSRTSRQIHSSNECDSTGEGIAAAASAAAESGSRSRTSRQVGSTKESTRSGRARSQPLTERQRIARTKLVLLFLHLFCASFRAIDVTAIYSDEWVVVSYFLFIAFGITAALFWCFYIYQHMSAFYVASFGDLRGPPRWTKYAGCAAFVAFLTVTLVFAILFFTTGRLFYHSIARIFHSFMFIAMALSLGVFVHTILRHMAQHQEKREISTAPSEEDMKRKRGIDGIRRFGYGTVAIFSLIAVLTFALNIPDLVNSPDRLREEDSQFGPREYRDPTSFKELQPIFMMFLLVLFAQRTQWIHKQDVRPSQKTSSLQTATSSLLAAAQPNGTRTLSEEPQSTASKSQPKITSVELTV